jgi:DNA-directed RNA polymerase subunit RPC12/RpoP
MSITCKFCNTRIEDAEEEGRTECPRCHAPLSKPLSSGQSPSPAPRKGDQEKCPECGSRLTFREGCMSCVNPACGWSACG